jgi:hypothetical protein
VESRVNRAEVLMANWKELEKKLLGFGEASGSTGRELTFRRYDFLRDGVWRLSADPKPHEKSNIELLKGSLSRMEKQLWSNVMARLMVKLRAELFSRPRLIKEFKEMKGLNERELKGFLNEKGFSALVPRLGAELDFERPWFGMKMSGELEECRRIEMELQVVRMHDWKYYPSLIDATLVLADGKRLNHEFLLSDYMLDAGMVTNMMQGRAVSVMDRDGSGGENQVWLQVHFDPQDSYLRRFHGDHGFDAGKLLSDFAVQVGKVDLDDERLLDELKKGNQVSFIAGAPFNRKLLLEADPSSKSLLVRNEMGERLEMQELMEQKKGHDIKISEGLPEIKVERNVGQVNGQERGIG